MSSVGNVNGVSNNTHSNDILKEKTGMGKDDFFKILATQIQYQNPLEPMQDTEFIGQMAQFTTLEQMQNLYQQNTFNQAVGLIGTTVTGVSQGNIFSGVVDKVNIIDNVPYIIVDGELYMVSEVMQIEYNVDGTDKIK